MKAWGHGSSLTAAAAVHGAAVAAIVVVAAVDLQSVIG